MENIETSESKTLTLTLMPTMTVGKFYKTYSQNGGDMYVKVYENESLIVMKSPLTISHRSGIFNLAGSKEIEPIEFQKAFDNVYFALLLFKNKDI